MSLEELAARTKIPRGSLEALEADRHEDLPGPVFVKGFLRCCARALHLEVDVVLELLLEQERVLLEREARAKARAEAEQEAAAERSGARVTPINGVRVGLAPEEDEDEQDDSERSSARRSLGASRTMKHDPSPRRDDDDQGAVGAVFARLYATLASALSAVINARLSGLADRLPRPRALMWIAFAMLLVVAVCSASVIAATGGLQQVALPHS